MYEETFETDWHHLDRRDAVERSFAIGVATVLGGDLLDEYERIRADASSAYDRTLIELAFNEGKRAASTPEHRGAKPTAVWATLVDQSAVTVPDTLPEERTGVPAALRRVDAGRPATRDLERIRLPAFLTNGP